MSHSAPSFSVHSQAGGYLQAPKTCQESERHLESWSVRQTHAAYDETLSDTLKRLSLYPPSYLRIPDQDLVRVAQDDFYATRPSGDHRKQKRWINLPVEIQLKIIGFLNEAIKEENPSLKLKVPRVHSTFRIPGPRRAILSRGFLAPLALVSKSFASLVNVFVWQALNLGVASVPETLAIEKRLKSSDMVGRHVHSVSMWWYEPQYNNIWAGWHEEPVYEAGLNILSSITKLISLELILNNHPPQYSVKPLSGRVKTLGRELMTNLRSFRLLTTWKIRQSEEELVVCMVEAAQRLKRFECHSGPRAMCWQHSQPAQSGLSSASAAPLTRQFRPLSLLLASLYELECLAVSCEGCLTPEWVSVKWNSRIKQLSVSDFVYTNWEVGSAFIKHFAHSLVHLELISDTGVLSGAWNAADSISLPNLRSLKLRIRSGERHGGYMQFLALFNTCPKILHFEFVKQRLPPDGSIQAASMVHGLEHWPKLKSVKLVLQRSQMRQITHHEIEQIRRFLNQKKIDFQIHRVNWCT